MRNNLAKSFAIGTGLAIAMAPFFLTGGQLTAAQSPPLRHTLLESDSLALQTFYNVISRVPVTPANVYAVSDPGDQPDDSLADGIPHPPTLRAAVQNANRFPDLDMITFAPSLTVIQKTTSNWPNIIYPVILDGLIADSGRIAIDGSTQPTGGGLLFFTGGCTIKNCEFRNFKDEGILLGANAGNPSIVQNCLFHDNEYTGINFNGSTKNLIGGALSGERNYIYSNGSGMTLLVGSDSNTIMGNYIGTRDGETAAGNDGYGIWIETAANHIVGNLISGNNNSAINTSDVQISYNVIESNLIGVNKDGTGLLANHGNGIVIGAGKGDTIRANTISGNWYRGVSVFTTIPDVVIEENFIGTDELGAYPIPNGYNGVGALGLRTIIQGNIIAGNTNGIESLSGDSCIIRDNIIGDYDLSTTPLGNVAYGISLYGGRGNRIGGPGAEDGNLISGNGQFGIRLQGTAVLECVIEGNLIGTNSSGLLALGNDSSGIILRSGTKRDTIRNNVISGNGLDGIVFSGPFDTLTGQNIVTGNLIGVAADSVTVLGNRRFGIFLDSSRGNVIGESGFPVNVIAGNDSSGIRLYRSRQNSIRGNLIGVLPDSTTSAPNGNDGVSLLRSSSNTLGSRDAGSGNLIAHNVGAGVRMFSGIGNRIVGNSIHDNALLGIDLVGQDLFRGVTLNDSADADTGANHLQNFPTLTFIGRSSGNASVRGFLEGNAGETYTIDFYSVNSPDVSGFGAGDSLLDSVAVVPDTSGYAHFEHQLTGNPHNIVATATGPDGSTSEFSKSPIMVNSSGDGTDVDVSNVVCNSGGPAINGVPECALRAALELAEKMLGPDYIGFDVAGSVPVVIHPNSQLPDVTESTVLDGATQAGYIEGTQAVRVNGTSAGDVPGIFIQDANCIIRGLVFEQFQTHGIRCSANSIKLQDIKASGNGGSGIYCDGNLTVTGPLVASFNGTELEADAGVKVAGHFAAESTEVNGNTGAGIRAGHVDIEGNLTASDNHAAGIWATFDVRVHGTNHTASNNGYGGIASLNSWVTIEGQVTANNNGHARTPFECLALSSGGITATKEVVLDKVSAIGNCGFGIYSGSFVWLKDNCTVTDNTETGLIARGDEVRLDGVDNLISDNGNTGLLANNGIVRVAHKLTLNNNGTSTRNEDPDFCLPGLGDRESEHGPGGLYASQVEAKDLVSTNNCGMGVGGGDVTITGTAKLDGNSSHGVAARIVRIAAGESCYNDGYGIVVLNPGGIVTGGILSLGAVKICVNGLGGVLVKPPPPNPMRIASVEQWRLLAQSSSTITGAFITDNAGDGIDWQSSDSLLVKKSNISGNSPLGITVHLGAGAVVANNVWWGSADGPGGSGPGTGDGVSGDVVFANWSASMHSLSLSTVESEYLEPGIPDTLILSLSKWTAGSALIDIHAIDTASWISSPHDFTVTASDTAPVVLSLEAFAPGGTPAGAAAELRVVATAESDPTATDTSVISLLTYHPQLSSILVVPDTATLGPGETANFLAFGFDQFDVAYPLLPVWSTDGGTITYLGLFTATSTLGDYTVSVSDTLGLVNATAIVHVVQTGCSCSCHADPQCDSLTDIFDVVQAVNVAFRNDNPIPDPDTNCPSQTTDANCDGVTDIFDVVRIVNVAFRNADPATEFCNPCL